MESLGHKRPKWRWLPRGVLGSVTGLLVFLLTWHFGWFSLFEERLYDIGLNLTNPPSASADCVIVAIDSLTSTRWRQPLFPISRHLAEHTRLVRALDSAGAKVICFDILFDELDSAGNDDIAAFAEVCRSAGTVLLGCSIEETADTQDRPLTARHLLLPQSTLLKSVAATGLVDVPLDGDDQIRRAVVGTQFQGTLMLSLSAQAVRMAGRTINFSTYKDSAIYIDYSWLSRIPVISYIDLLEHADMDRLVCGKIAVIGTTVDNGNDNYHIPLKASNGSSRLVPGVSIQAAAMQTLLGDRHTRTASLALGLIVLILLGAFVATLVNVSRAWISIASYVLVSFLLIIASVLAVPYAHLILPTGKWLFSLASWLAMYWISGITLLRKETASQQAAISEFTGDMQSAQVIQQHLQPRNVPKISKLDIAVKQLTSKEVGGDYFDFVNFNDGKIGFLIGDVAGKGVSASLIMSNVQAIFRKEASQEHSPSAVLQAINTHLNPVSNASSRFISLFYGILDSVSGRLIYSNGGHCPPIVRSAGGEIYSLSGGELFVGPLADMRWNVHETRLRSGDLLCLFTDGVSEAYEGDILNQFREERIVDCLKRSSGTSQEILDDLLGTCRSFVRGGQFQDDWTVIIMKLQD